MIQVYELLIEPIAHQQRKQLPGHIRQRVKRAIDDLEIEPRPHYSKQLDISRFDVPVDVELRRIRLDKWRLIYAVNDIEKWIWIWGVRKRPPYDYEDLTELTQSL
ncbi:MAG TPA: type II toxin-antitoxin system RelE/ParE family toxin [Gammaproteobacteria bacterium]|nr:type II toxin-antitoxin system RelE/ParE family toxin [Gammaproteobacteria bacterium]